MTRTYDAMVEVEPGTSRRSALRTAVRVVVPDGAFDAASPVVFAFPGGGYNRRYFDLDVPGHAGYSQAAHHATRGIVFVACDHIGVGESDTPGAALGVEAVAALNAATVRAVLDRLRTGTLAASLPPVEASKVIGLGHSYGGFLLTLTQAASASFDAVAMLGWSGVATTPPWPRRLTRETVLSGTQGNGLDHPKRPWFHLPDVPIDIVTLDMTKVPGSSASQAAWSTPHGAGGPRRVADRDPLTPGVVRDEAAAIDVPVFIGVGEVDVVPDPWAEPAAYRRSADVTLAVVAGMAHIHNLATTRRDLWTRLDHWIAGVAGRA